MSKKKLSRKARLEAVMWEHTAHCCKSCTFPGKMSDTEMYVCQQCGGEMKVTDIRVLDRKKAEWVLRRKDVLEVACPDCNEVGGHEIREDKTGAAYFMYCGKCGTELAEISELTEGDTDGEEKSG